MQDDREILYVDWESSHDELFPVLEDGMAAPGMPCPFGKSFDLAGLSFDSAVKILQPLLPMRKEVWGTPFLMDKRHGEAGRWSDCVGFGWSWFFHVILLAEHGRLGGMLLSCGGGNDEAEWKALRDAIVALDRVCPSVLKAPGGGFRVSDEGRLNAYFAERRSHRWG